MNNYFVDIQYMYEFNDIHSKFCTYDVGIKTVENFDKLKEWLEDFIEWNIRDNKEWYDEIVKNFDEIDKFYIQKESDNTYDYFAEKAGYKESFGCESIYRIFITEITKKNTIDFIGIRELNF